MSMNYNKEKYLIKKVYREGGKARLKYYVRTEEVRKNLGSSG